MSVIEEYEKFKKDPVTYLKDLNYDFSKLPDTPPGVNSAVFFSYGLQDSSLAYQYRGPKGTAVDEALSVAGLAFRDWMMTQATYGGDEEVGRLLDSLFDQSLEDFFKREDVRPYRTDIGFVSAACIQYGLSDSYPGGPLQERGIEANRFFSSLLVNPMYFTESAFKAHIEAAVNSFPMNPLAEETTQTELCLSSTIQTEVTANQDPSNTNLTLEDILNDPNL